MDFYQYLVLNTENKKLSGTISADDQTKARGELNNLGFSIISITKINKEEYDKLQGGKPVFEFNAYDKHSKKIFGTIPAIDKYTAFKKLQEEYLFTVINLYPKNISDKEKEAEKLKGLDDLKKKAEEEKKIAIGKGEEKAESAPEAGELTNEQKKNQATMENKISLILNKIKEILDKYETELIPKKVKEIKNLVNKLIRIKSSTNFDFVEKTCEELLKSIQDQELFIKDSKLIKEKQSINLETKKMLIELHKKESAKKTDFVSSLKNLNKTEGKQNFLQKFINPLINNLIAFFETPEEIKLLNDQLKNTNGQIITYIKLWISSPKEEKNEIVKSIKTILNERKRIKKEIKKIKQKNKTSSKETDNLLISFYQETSLFTGWLLLFYLSLYFIANYSKTKNIPGMPDFLIQFYDLPILKYLTLIIFTTHIFINIKLLYLPKSLLATILVIPATIFICLFLVLNF